MNQEWSRQPRRGELHRTRFGRGGSRHRSAATGKSATYETGGGSSGNAASWTWRYITGKPRQAGMRNMHQFLSSGAAAKDAIRSTEPAVGRMRHLHTEARRAGEAELFRGLRARGQIPKESPPGLRSAVPPCELNGSILRASGFFATAPARPRRVLVVAAADAFDRESEAFVERSASQVGRAHLEGRGRDARGGRPREHAAHQPPRHALTPIAGSTARLLMCNSSTICQARAVGDQLARPMAHREQPGDAVVGQFGAHRLLAPRVAKGPRLQVRHLRDLIGGRHFDDRELKSRALPGQFRVGPADVDQAQRMRRRGLIQPARGQPGGAAARFGGGDSIIASGTAARKASA